jgi:hypothetical protein
VNEPIVFIGYSHRDEVWKDRLVAHLGVSQQQGLFELWDDRRIVSGDKWLDEIQKSLDNAPVAILLVSANSLASDFLLRGDWLELHKKRQGSLVIFPVIITSCDWESVDWLRRIQVRPKNGRPLDLGTEAQINADLASIAKEIRSILEVVSAKQNEPSDNILSHGKEVGLAKGEHIHENEQKVDFFISHCHVDGDFAELLKLRIEKEGYTAWTDIERLSVGVDWRQEIDLAIKSAAALIVVMTPEAKQSEYVTYEWAYAWGIGVKVIPIMLKNTQLHPRLETLQYLDFTNREARPYSKLLKALQEAKRNKV